MYIFFTNKRKTLFINHSYKKVPHCTAKCYKTESQVVLVFLWSLVKRLDSHAAVISQGQSHTPLSPPSLIPCRFHCSFVALAAGGAVRLESAPPWLSLLHNKAVTYSTLLCPLPSITHLHTSTASHCSILRQPAAIGQVGTSALRKVSLDDGMKCLQMKCKIKKEVDFGCSVI